LEHFAIKKYEADSDWLTEHQGFTLGEASRVVSSLLTMLEKKLLDVLKSLKGKPPEEWTLLPGFQFTAEEVVSESKVDEAVAKKVLEAFCLKDTNSTFTSLNAFNATNAFPLLRLGEGQYTMFQYVALAESLYESPFFWMLNDKKYQPTATTNRVKFVKTLAAERLEKIFEPARVFKNVDIGNRRARKSGKSTCSSCLPIARLYSRPNRRS
jgi:hypothetical protein